ncbi:MAG: NfeD family protein [Glaciecola sp.]
MNWFASNLIETVLIIGLVLLIIEILVLGFSTFFLFFAGLAAVATSVIMWLGILPETFIYAIFSIACFTAFFALTLWKKLAAIQGDVDHTRATSDLIGHSFVLPVNIVAAAPDSEKPDYQFSGLSWKLSSMEDLNQGDLVEVIQVDVGMLTVQAKPR